MSYQLKKIEDCKFTEMKEELAETLKIMTSSWSSSKYFCKVPSRISVLIQKFCFFLMQKVLLFTIFYELKDIMLFFVVFSNNIFFVSLYIEKQHKNYF